MLGRIANYIARAHERRRLKRVFSLFRSLAGDDYRLPIDWGDRMLCTRDAGQSFDRHYVYHTAWAARQVASNAPAEHVDIGSSLYFCSIMSAFVPTKFYDYRPAGLGLTGLEEGFADLTRLPFADGSVASLSCMHVVEHVGLGRYGDEVDPDGDVKAASELSRVLAPGGILLAAVPVGRPRVVFNAHRVYAPQQVAAMFDGLVVESFALVPDFAEDGGLVPDAAFSFAQTQEYGCGCFVFRKPVMGAGQ